MNKKYGCYHCFNEYSENDIAEALALTEGRLDDVLCPNCFIDALIPIEEYFTIDRLKLIHNQMFNKKSNF